jgi:hypothetical protein
MKKSKMSGGPTYCVIKFTFHYSAFIFEGFIMFAQMFFETSFFLAFSRPSAGSIEPLNGPYLARGP